MQTGNRLVVTWGWEWIQWLTANGMWELFRLIERF